jgi:hypothetical protein
MNETLADLVPVILDLGAVRLGVAWGRHRRPGREVVDILPVG